MRTIVFADNIFKYNSIAKFEYILSIHKVKFDSCENVNYVYLCVLMVHGAVTISDII